MTTQIKIMTPEQVAVIRSSQWLGEGKEELLTPVAILCDSHKAVWEQLTEAYDLASQLRDNLGRIHATSAGLRKELTEAQAALRECKEYLGKYPPDNLQNPGSQKQVRIYHRVLSLPAMQLATGTQKEPTSLVL